MGGDEWRNVIRFEPTVIQHLKRVARFEAVERDADVTVADLIREPVLQVYPMPKEAYEQEGTEA